MENKYVGYEYFEVEVLDIIESLCIDCMKSFGWILVNGASLAENGVNKVSLKFKRNRDLRNKAELTRLQLSFVNNIRELEGLEKSKSRSASITAFSIGLVGTVCMAGAVFSYLSGLIPLTVFLAIPGFGGWIAPYFSFKKIKDKKIKSLEPIISEQYDSIYKTCEKANRLINV